MDLWEKIVEAYPELNPTANWEWDYGIVLQDDSDGQGAYIKKWQYSKPIPEGLHLGKSA